MASIVESGWRVPLFSLPFVYVSMKVSNFLALFINHRPRFDLWGFGFLTLESENPPFVCLYE